MKPIPISSCHLCDSETWIVEKDSKYDYKCKNCGRIIRKILRRKDWKDESTR